LPLPAQPKANSRDYVWRGFREKNFPDPAQPETSTNSMKLSVIVATRNRAHAIAESLDSIAASLAKAAPLDAEIVVVDNGSRDATSRAVEQWAAGCPFPVRLLWEPRPGLSVARNRALGSAWANYSFSPTTIAA
jgi:hypothetical protein